MLLIYISLYVYLLIKILFLIHNILAFVVFIPLRKRKPKMKKCIPCKAEVCLMFFKNKILIGNAE